MPVHSPTLNSSVANEPMRQDLAKNASPTLSEKEETNENVRKAFVMGALREKEQVNYFISCTSVINSGTSSIMVSFCYI
jgi:hypothetical protein